MNLTAMGTSALPLLPLGLMLSARTTSPSAISSRPIKPFNQIIRISKD